MTVERQVGGKSVYLTEEGAAAFDKLAQQGWNVDLRDDPKGLAGFFGGDVTGPKGEQYPGKP